MGSGFKNGMTAAVLDVPVHWAAFKLPGLCLGLGWECAGPTVAGLAVASRGLNHIPSVTPSLV